MYKNIIKIIIILQMAPAHALVLKGNIETSNNKQFLQEVHKINPCLVYQKCEEIVYNVKPQFKKRAWERAIKQEFPCYDYKTIKQIDKLIKEYRVW